MAILVSTIWLIAVAWLIARAVHQRAALRSLLPQPVSRATPSVGVIVPARDEAANIGRCLAALSAQSYPAMRVAVIDDQSTDTTAAIAAACADRDPRVELIRAPPLPAGWVGKCHACWIGARAVVAAEWLCFMDADVFAEPNLLTTAVATAEAERITLLSLAPRHELHSFSERLMLPCGLYLLAFTQNVKQVSAQNRSDVHITGQFMLVRREAYESVGGHKAVRDAICEDNALASLIKRAGHKVVLYGGDQVLSTRMYSGWATLWPGLAKNLVDMLGGTRATILKAALAVIVAWAAVVIPIADAVACSHGGQEACVALAIALPASAAAFGLHLAGTAFFRIPFWYGLLFPLGYTVGALIAIDSVRRRLSGRVTWKGRTYP